MIKIKNFIFNENEIQYINKTKENIYINFRDGDIETIPSATFEDIEWNYEDEQIRKCLDSISREEELEEENKQLKELNVCVGCENNPDYKTRINKAKRFIIENAISSDKWEEIEPLQFKPIGWIKYKQLSKNKVEELLKILKGE